MDSFDSNSEFRTTMQINLETYPLMEDLKRLIQVTYQHLKSQRGQCKSSITLESLNSIFYIITWIFRKEENKYNQGFPRRMHPPRFRPTETNVTFIKGSLAILKCSVENLGTKTIIWRKQPYNVPITVGSEQFIELNRFYLNHIPNTNQWNLLIKNVQIHDSGTYECQISSKTKVLRRNITLNVIYKDNEQTRGGINMSGTRFVRRGQQLYLMCNASGTDGPPEGIDWFKNGNMLTSKRRSDINIQKQISISTQTISSTLRINKAELSDAGTYVCRTSDLFITRFKVDVLNEDPVINVKREPQLSGIVTQTENSSKSTAVSIRHFFLPLSIISPIITGFLVWNTVR